jgi:N-acetylneuraminic acid mutarotase
LRFFSGGLRKLPPIFSNLPKATARHISYAGSMLSNRLIRFVAAMVTTAVLSGRLPAADAYPPMPETVTSFGAVTCDGWLYTFGGHKGERHDYSAEMVSGSFYRLKLKGGQAWEPLPSAAPGQGQPLVAYSGSIYRIGGMAARNHKDAKQDLYSLALVQCFDVRGKHWEDVAPLPAPRSSHDAVVIGSRLYVAGGWQLKGGTNKPIWPVNALMLDLTRPQAGWHEFSQPFQRRALALATDGSHVYCIGGMDSNNEPTLAVDVYDPTGGEWTKGPDLPPGKYKGFSCSAIAQDGRIYVTEFQGDLLRLSSDARSWEIVGRLEKPRMAHRLVTAGTKQLIALGGEDGDENKITGLEVLTPAKKPLVIKTSLTSATQADTATHQ